jgi:hypothetical protein
VLVGGGVGSDVCPWNDWKGLGHGAGVVKAAGISIVAQLVGVATGPVETDGAGVEAAASTKVTKLKSPSPEPKPSQLPPTNPHAAPPA